MNKKDKSIQFFYQYSSLERCRSSDLQVNGRVVVDSLPVGVGRLMEKTEGV